MHPPITITAADAQEAERTSQIAVLRRLIEFPQQDAFSGFTNQDALGLAWIDRETVGDTVKRYLAAHPDIDAQEAAKDDATPAPIPDVSYALTILRERIAKLNTALLETLRRLPTEPNRTVLENSIDDLRKIERALLGDT